MSIQYMWVDALYNEVGFIALCESDETVGCRQRMYNDIEGYACECMCFYEMEFNSIQFNIFLFV